MYHNKDKLLILGGVLVVLLVFLLIADVFAQQDESFKVERTSSEGQ